MAGIKITDLPAAPSALLTDVFPVDQLPGPVTYKESNTQLLTLFKANGEALTRTNDTNVTMTLGGSPTTALLNASSMTLGWTGQLSVARGGTGLAALTAHYIPIGNGTTALTLLAPSATSGVPLISQGVASDPAYGTAVVAGGGTGNTTFTAYSVICAGTTATGAFQNVVGVGAAGEQLTSNGAGLLPTWQAGTVSPLTTKGDIYTYTTTNARLPVGATNGQVLQVASGSASGIAWSTATFPATATNAARILRSDGTNWVETTATFADSYAASGFLYANGANNVAGLATANNGLPVTGNTGIPVMLAGPAATGRVLTSNAAAAPSWSTSTFPSVGGAAGNILISDGTNYIASTSLWPNTVGSAGKLLRSDGTTNAYTTSTYPDTNAISTLLYASSANVMSALATANNGILVTSSGGVPSIGNTVGAGLTMPSITFNSTSGIIGTTTNDSAAALSVGEHVISTVTTVAISNNTSTDATSISLTAGDWDVSGNLSFNSATTTTVNAINCWISSTSASLPANISTIARQDWGSTGVARAGSGISAGCAIAPQRFSLSGTTTIYLSGFATFATSTLTMDGFISARRRR